MPRNWTRAAALAMAGAIMIAVSAGAGDPTASLKQGKPELKSAGPLAFGPDGILFVGDTQGAALFAIDTGDRAAGGREAAGQGQGPGRQGRRRCSGTDAKQVRSTTWPSTRVSGNVYLSVVARHAAPTRPR